MQKDESLDLHKILLTFALLFIVFFGAVFVTSSYPQDILINQDTILKYGENLLAFQDINEQGANITLNGKDYRVNNYDVISLGSRNSLTLTGNQFTINNISYFNGKLIVPTRINHIILFEQSTLNVPSTFDLIELSYQNHNITISNLNGNVYNIESGQSTYNVLIPDNQFTYITDDKNIAMYKIQNKNNNLEITLIGYYTDKEFIITIRET